MFPFRENPSLDFYGKAGNNKEIGQQNVIRCDEVSSTNDIFENVDCFDHNFDLENIDPSLFCPDIILELGDTPIFINNDNRQNKNEHSSANNFDSMENKAISDVTVKKTEVKKKPFGTANSVQYTRIHCTACNDHLGSALSQSRNRCVHPLLKVLICKECHEFYTGGEFEKDDDGSEAFCRWCGQGGQVWCCSKCDFVFCTVCIRNNLGMKKLAEIKNNDDWICFSCNISQIIELRSHCAQLMEYVDKEILRTKTLANAQSLMTIDYSNCCLNLENGKGKKKKRRMRLEDPTYNPYKQDNSSGKACSSKMLPFLKPTKAIPREVSSTNGKMFPERGNNIANADSVGKLEPCQPKVKPSFDEQIKFSNATSPNPPQTKISPTNQKAIITKNKIQVPRNIPPLVPLRKTTTAGQEALRCKKFFYERTMRSASTINSDLSRELTRLKHSKAPAVGLEGMVVAHNKLQTVLNKSIQSLMEVQMELVECKPGKSNTKSPSDGNTVKSLHIIDITTD